MTETACEGTFLPCSLYKSQSCKSYFFHSYSTLSPWTRRLAPPCRSQAVHHSEDPLYPHELLRASVLLALSSDPAGEEDAWELSSATGGGDVDEDEDEVLDEDLEDVLEEDEISGGEVGVRCRGSFTQASRRSSCVVSCFCGIGDEDSPLYRRPRKMISMMVLEARALKGDCLMKGRRRNQSIKPTGKCDELIHGTGPSQVGHPSIYILHII